MIVLGVDPGSRVTGWGVITKERGKYKLIASGHLRADPDSSLASRICLIYEGLISVIKTYNPDQMAIEAIFKHKSSESALILGHARGVCLLAGAQANLPIGEYSPSHVKKSVSGYGNADKQQVARMVSMLVGITVEGPTDVTDAIAIAITHFANYRPPK